MERPTRTLCKEALVHNPGGSGKPAPDRHRADAAASPEPPALRCLTALHSCADPPAPGVAVRPARPDVAMVAACNGRLPRCPAFPVRVSRSRATRAPLHAARARPPDLARNTETLLRA